MSLQSGQMFSHYRLAERIGEGGMGVVWRADDTVLQRPVAIKFLRGDVSREEQRRERFLKEARLASSLSDAHIVQVHDFGHDQDLDFLVMEYIEGEPLNHILRGRPLPVRKIADIGHQIAQALAKAHRKNLLHRDLKPANILITPDGDVKVVDFGLARLFRRDESLIESTATTRSLKPGEAPASSRSGIAGTIPYMSPEQVRGDKLDSRSDIFSLGTILFEMTTGKQPFVGASNMEIAQEIEQCNPPPVHDLVPSVPLDLDRTIQKAMARQRADRYQTMEDMAVDLKHLSREIRSGPVPSYEEAHQQPPPPSPRVSPSTMALGAALAIALAVTTWSLWPDAGVESQGGAPASGVTAPASTRSRIGVLSPRNLVGDAEIAGWPQLIQILLAGELMGVEDLGIVDPLSLNGLLEQSFGTEHPTGREPRLYQVLQEAGLAYVLDGSILRVGGGYQIHSKLVDPATGEVSFTQQVMVRREEDLPDGAATLAEGVLDYLQVSEHLLAEDRDIRPWVSLRKQNLEAVKAFIQASHNVMRMGPAVENHLRRAIQADPDFVAPRVWLIPSLVLRGETAEAEIHFQHLTALQPRVNPFEQAMIGWAGAFMREDVPDQARYLEIALDFSPGNNVLLANLADARANLGDLEGAIEAMASPMKMVWPYPPLYFLWGYCNILTGSLDEARKGMESGLNVSPVIPEVYALLEALSIADDDPDGAQRYRDLFESRIREMGPPPDPAALAPAYARLASLAAESGAHRPALELFRKAAAVEPENPDHHLGIADSLYSLEDLPEAEREYLRVLELDPGRARPHLILGRIEDQRGKRQEAIDHYEEFILLADENEDTVWARGQIEALRE